LIDHLTNNIDDYPEGIVLPIDKPYRWTSADVIRKVKYAAVRHFGKKNLKVGHAGTLDPLATGILLVCIGPATRKAEDLQKSRKQYLAGISFGATTPSYDLEKDIDKVFSLDGVSEESIAAILPSFVGEQDQVAPLFSAKSVDGVRIYETARKLLKQAHERGMPFGEFQETLIGTESENILQASRINIYGLTLESYSPCLVQDFVDDGYGRIRVADVSGHTLPTAMIRVDCSKGTYIRSLARDIGEALGSGAFLSSLRRTCNGGYSIDDALSLDDALKLLKPNTTLI